MYVMCAGNPLDAIGKTHFTKVWRDGRKRTLKGANDFAILSEDRCVVNIDGVLYEGQIPKNKSQIKWNDGDIWNRIAQS